jgi:chromosome segregation protein
VHDLLMDTGLGAKAYSIIEQGKIGMILSTRPTDRRQLIEEAAGVTKYKARRRSAELKLEAAQQNLTRIDDIVFEVEKQRGTLKRQAGKARRYQRLRDELRRWEKVLFARKYRQLAEVIESARTRLTEARERESIAAARVAEGESRLGRLRIELVEAESTSTEAREAAHARELAMTRQEQQIAFDREQVVALEGADGVGRGGARRARRPPRTGAALLAGRRDAAAGANAERDRAAAALASESGQYETAHREIEGLEADVEAARSEVFSALNSAANRAAARASSMPRRRANACRRDGWKLEIETERSPRRVGARGRGVGHASTPAPRHEAIESSRNRLVGARSELASARIEHEWARPARCARAKPSWRASNAAQVARGARRGARRLRRCPRTVLVPWRTIDTAGPRSLTPRGQAGYERAVEGCLGDLLQHVVVERPEHAAAGFIWCARLAPGDAGSGASAAGATDAAGLDASMSVRRRVGCALPRPGGVVHPPGVVRCRRCSGQRDRLRGRFARRPATPGSPVVRGRADASR